MRKAISLIIALALCFCLAGLPEVSADGFVPSISYKDGPDIVDADPHGDCLIVTTVPEAEEKTTDIYQEDRDLLLEVFEELMDGSMEMPLEEGYVVRDLVDVSWKKTTCVEAEHGHKEWLHKEDTQITVTFDLGVSADEEVIVLVYLNGEWVPAKSVKNNGDGTVTVVFEDICPVAFCVIPDYEADPPKTGDEMGQNLLLYVCLLAASVAGIVILLLIRKKKRS